jgi:hypothetical protein
MSTSVAVAMVALAAACYHQHAYANQSPNLCREPIWSSDKSPQKWYFALCGVLILRVVP